jgi:membrane associated rhomboid family serine protease
MPTSICAALAINGIFWGILVLVDNDGSVPIWAAIGPIVGGALMFVVWHRAWERRG